MLSCLMLAVALTTDPAVVAAWPVSDLDAELAVTESGLRSREAECRAGVEYFEKELARYVKNLNDTGDRSEAALKVAGVLARRRDSCMEELQQAHDRLAVIRDLRAKERPAGPAKK